MSGMSNLPVTSFLRRISTSSERNSKFSNHSYQVDIIHKLKIV